MKIDFSVKRLYVINLRLRDTRPHALHRDRLLIAHHLEALGIFEFKDVYSSNILKEQTNEL